MKRLLLSFVLSFTPTYAVACSCSGWTGGYVSELSSAYESFWAVPIGAKVNRVEIQEGYFSSQVTFDLVILEDFGRLTSTDTTAISSPVDGGSCGVQLDMGTPQFVTAYRNQDGGMNISSCSPQLPYSAIKLYLETGEDTYIPSDSLCYEAIELGHSVEGADLESCEVWRDAFKSTWQRHGDEDYLTYIKMWRQKQESP